ncbi:unnamed protein product [Lupinus luteus]|uniref:Coenzyme Q-binding protein COQ10 START domain-containing protein n=1 Tax=Lupinus luteus TaxID=3873 RepID=A0AAV1VTH7_LUPLU
MHVIPATSQISLSPLKFLQPAPSLSNSISITHSFLVFHPFHFNTHYSISTHKPRSLFKFTPSLLCASKSNPTTDDNAEYYSGDLLIAEEEDYDGDGRVEDEEEGSESLTEDGVYIEVMKMEKNTRRIESRISIEASLDAIWSILTDYERLSDFIPGLAVSQLIQKGDRYARLLQKTEEIEQIGQQNLAFGIKFNAKGVVDCFEKELETLPSGMKRDIEFKMVEGDFQIFEGKWSILQQFNIGSCEESQEVNTTLSYILDVKPKLWLPVHLIEGRLCNEIKKNLTSIRKEALKDSDRALHAQ